MDTTTLILHYGRYVEAVLGGISIGLFVALIVMFALGYWEDWRNSKRQVHFVPQLIEIRRPVPVATVCTLCTTALSTCKGDTTP